MKLIAERITDRSMRLIARMLAAGRVITVARGLENLPPTGPVLIVARHYHHLFDGLLLFRAIERHFHIVVTLDWATNWRSKTFMETVNRLARWPMVLRADALARDLRGSGGFFATPDIRRYQRRALRETVELLCEERVVVIFPEGYPTVDPNFSPKAGPEDFLPFKSGFANIAAGAEKRCGVRVPIIPAGLRYEQGDPWVGYLTLGQSVYRDSFASKPALVQFLEQQVWQLSRDLSRGGSSTNVRLPPQDALRVSSLRRSQT